MSVGSLLSPEGEATERCHDAIEILIPGEGGAASVVHRTDDGRTRKAFVCAPMVAVIPPGVDCAVHCRRPNDTLVLWIDAGFFDEQTGAAQSGMSAGRLAPRYAALDPFIRELGRDLQDEMRRDEPLGESYLTAMAGVVAVHLARHYGEQQSSPPTTGLAQHKVKSVQAFVRDHISETIHVDELAAQVHMSPFHFARMFKQSTGQTPHLYVVMQRVETAKDLLRGSEDPLIEVAARAGFRTQGHFTGVFHRYTGFTPHVFRSHCRAMQEG
jgi:AraC family transcriptional regulator